MQKIKLLSRPVEFKEILRQYKSASPLCVTGAWDSAKACLAAFLLDEEKTSAWVVTESELEAERFCRDFKFFSSIPCVRLPSWETLPHEKIAPHIDIVAERFSALDSMRQTSSNIVLVSSIQAVLHRVISTESLMDVILELNCGEETGLRNLIEFLEKTGYRRESVAETKGTYSVRGGIVDMFSPQKEQAFRAEFEGQKVISLRKFDPETQVSSEEVECVRIYPACEMELREKEFSWTGVKDYLPKNHVQFILNPADIREKQAEILSDVPAGSSDYIQENSWQTEHALFLEELPSGGAADGKKVHLTVERSSSWQPAAQGWSEHIGVHSDVFLTLAEKSRQGYRVIFVSRNGAEAQRLQQILKEKDAWSDRHEIVVGDLSRGFILPERKIALLTEHEIFGKLQARAARSTVRRGLPIREYSELKSGDWIVHLVYGIGKFLGVSQLDEKGGRGEFLTIEYDKGAKLHVPVDQIELVEKYIGIKGHAPKLSRLGGKDWERSKKKAQLELMDFASELLELQAKRAALGGHAFKPDTPWQIEFEKAFIYNETPDQLQAIEEVKRDLEAPSPMDRLICGDVGFGKTEVAIRAAFKVVMEGKQVAVLVPTTVLAQQHLYTFRERFSGYPLEVEMLSRFRTAEEQIKIIKKLKNGQVDVIIGTHRLLGSDVEFKDLGLVIIDEEQRFGVLHKEKFKKMRTLVDVLTLTATPIPRTLYMTVMQAKDVSLIHTPPEDRLPIETMITHYDDRLVRDAIVREIARDGQVFYVHNRVQSIYRVRDHLKKLIPQARFAVGHGQMNESELEEAMKLFIEGKVQVLVSTNIVESGLDIPNANTIIIDRAELFGLADLYQLRGRVGRFKHRAYAYFLYSKSSILNREAKERLKTIQDFTGLGAGFKVALRDLEIRGAGNILGKQQHGHISAIGFSLYCRLLDETIRRLKGEKVVEKNPVSLQLGFEMIIPQNYIREPFLRMQMYHKIFETQTADEIQKVTHELNDRFGPPPPEVLLLLEIAQLKGLARQMKITSIHLFKNRIYFRQADMIRRVEPLTVREPVQLVRKLKNILKEKISYVTLRKNLRVGK